MRGDVPGATIGFPVDSFQTRTPSIGEMYQRAAAGGGEVKLYSREESEAINAQYRAGRRENAKIIDAQFSGKVQADTNRLSRLSGRTRATRRLDVG